jgi:hypothetical protein
MSDNIVGPNDAEILTDRQVAKDFESVFPLRAYFDIF